MSSLVGRTAVFRLSLKNQFLNRAYPEAGRVHAIVDTGYDGFMTVPEGVFRSLGLNEMSPRSRSVYTADNRPLELKSALASVEVEGLAGSIDGRVETGPGVAEILVGTLFLSRFKLTVNYCSGAFRAEPCA